MDEVREEGRTCCRDGIMIKWRMRIGSKGQRTQCLICRRMGEEWIDSEYMAGDSTDCYDRYAGRVGSCRW